MLLSLSGVKMLSREELETVHRAVRWAYIKSQCEDEMNAAKNLSDEVKYGPLTRALQQAYSVTLRNVGRSEPPLRVAGSDDPAYVDA